MIASHSKLLSFLIASTSADQFPPWWLVVTAIPVSMIGTWLGGKVLMHARLDGRKLSALSIVRSTGKVAKSVVLTALQGMEVYSISCRGLGR